MRLEDRIVWIADNIGCFVASNPYYHVILIMSSIYMVGYGIPLVLEAILGNDV